MQKRTYQRTFIREWREHRGLSLQRLADRLTEPDGTPVISAMSLSRIERGIQPYSQPVLEAIAKALNTDPASLIMRDPSQPEAIWTIWDQLEPADRERAVIMLDALRRKAS